MITEQDLREAIAECEGKRDPSSSTCIKLAAFYTIRNELFGKQVRADEPLYSYAAPPVQNDPVISYTSGTEFGSTINGMSPEKVWPIMDELMDTIHTLMPRLYDGVMRRLQE